MLIIFDLDDTLIDTTGSVTPAMRALALQAMERAGLRVSEQEKKWLSMIDAVSESGVASIRFFLTSVGADPALAAVGKAVWYGDLPEGLRVEAMPGANNVLKSLSEKHKLAIVSIGNPDLQMLKIEKGGINSAFFSKIVIVPEEDKKPSYQKVMQDLGVSPRETVVCGDRIQRDLRPAKELGCVTAHLLWGRGLHAQGKEGDVDFTIRSLEEIEGIVEKL